MRSVLDDIAELARGMSPEEQAEVVAAAREATVGYLWVPNPGPQTAAYHSPADELYYGGQAGGGKSDLLLGLALNEHTISRIFRRQHNDRQALVERLAQILGTRDGYNGSDHVWRVPNTHTVIRFGAMSDPNAWERYQGDPTDFKGWDEITQFRRHEYETVNAWLRPARVDRPQRCRIVAAGNPPVTAEALWVIGYWGPWLDPQHPRPAKDGELRWFTTIDDESVEVSADWREVGPNGREIRPRSRTFIRAAVSDNPDMVDADYESTLANLPAHLRAALLEGRFQAAFEDNAWQVIPTEWVLAAQQRWQAREGQSKETRGPMTAIGLDPSGGGGDRTVIVPTYGTFVGEPIVKTGHDLKNPRVIAGAAIEAATDDPQFNIDCTGGWGNGPAEHLESNKFAVVRCNFSGASERRDRSGKYRFANKRAEYYWLLREALDPVNGEAIALPPGRRIVAELTAVRWEWRSGDVIQMSAKDDIRKMLGESPDIGDAIALALAEVGSTTRTRPGMQGDAFRFQGGGVIVNRTHGRTGLASIGDRRR